CDLLSALFEPLVLLRPLALHLLVSSLELRAVLDRLRVEKRLLPAARSTRGGCLARGCRLSLRARGCCRGFSIAGVLGCSLSTGRCGFWHVSNLQKRKNRH